MDERPSKRTVSKLIVILVLAVSCAAAVGFLFFRISETALPVSVRFVNLPEGLVIVGKVPSVEAQVKGRVGALADLKRSRLIYAVDMGSVDPGKEFLEIDTKQITVPEDVLVTAVDPASFVIRVDEKTQKRVPVVPDIAGEPAPGYIMSSASASPARVRITGPATILDQISALRTTPIDLAGLRESTRRNVALSVNDVDEIQVSDDGLVEIDIKIEERIIERWMELKVRAIETDYKYEVSPSHIQVLLKGPENAFKKLAEDNRIDVRVNLEALKPGTYFRHAVIEPPLDMVVLETKPTTFRVEVFGKE